EYLEVVKEMPPIAGMVFQARFERASPIHRACQPVRQHSECCRDAGQQEDRSDRRLDQVSDVHTSKQVMSFRRFGTSRPDCSLFSIARYHAISMRTLSRHPDERLLLETCHARSIELLRRNLSPAGILAATPGKRADLRGYTAIFGRDAAVCALGMALSGDPVLEREAATGLRTLAAHQASNGQIPKFVDVQRREADFWYLGCIDSTLWWLIALAFLDSRAPQTSGGLRKRYANGVRLAVQWLLAQEHQRFFLLQQNEASDWADIMPRSGFVLYTNALWYCVKRLYG